MTSRNDTRYAYNRHAAAQLPNSNENAGNDTTAAGPAAPLGGTSSLAPAPIKSLAPPAAGLATRAGAHKIQAAVKPKTAVATRATRATAAANAASSSSTSTTAAAAAASNDQGAAGIKRTASRQPKIMNRQEQQLAVKHEAKVAPVPTKAGYYESIAEEVVAAPASKARKTIKMETARVSKSATAASASASAAPKPTERVDSGSVVPVEDQQDAESPRSKRLRLCEEVARELGVDQIVARNPRTGRLCLIEDPDEEDMHDPAMCGEYAQEILDYLVIREKVFQPKAYYVTQQGDMSWGMRSVLVDWLFEVHKKFEFLPETMFLAVSLLDRFMSLRQCDIGKFQLVGLTCLFIAAKIEEVSPPQIGTLVYMADNGFAEADMIAAESYILKTLDFNLWAPGPFSFIRRISKADEYDLHNRNLTKYLVEVALMDHRFLAYPMSQIAAGAFFVARAANVFQTSSKGTVVTMSAGEYAAEALEWGVYFVQSSGYCRKELVPIVALFNDFFSVKVGESAKEWAFFTAKLANSKRYRDLGPRIGAVVAALELEPDCDAVVQQHADMDAEALEEARLGVQAAEIRVNGGVAPPLPNGGRLGVWKPLPVAQIE